jgi:acyl-CoA synthetase (NDP forming)
VLAVKAGRTSAGARAASSHTGALIAASDSTVDALFASAGVLRCDSLDDLLDAAAVLAEQPTPKGDCVGIVCNARGPGVVCADACVDAGLGVASLSAQTQDALRAVLPPASTVAGPVQLVASETPAGFRGAVELVAADPAVDAVIAIFVEHIATGAYEAAAALAAAAPQLHAAGTPLLTVFMTPGPLPEILREGMDRRAPAASDAPFVKVPTFRAPEAAARALGRAAAYGRFRAHPPAEPARLSGIDGDAAAAVLAQSLARGGGWLRPDEVAALLDAYGIALVEQRRVGSVAAAEKAAAELGGPVALKGVATGLVHKAQAGAVRLDLNGPTAVRRAALEIAQRLEAAGTPAEGFLVQRMAGAGVEMLVGVLGDERFGPVVACGAGGGTAEVLEDVAVRLAPLAPEEAHEMIAGLRSRALLERARADVDALADIAVRVGALADAHPAIAELDLNPVMAGPGGAAVVDARVRVAPPAVQPVFPAVGR